MWDALKFGSLMCNVMVFKVLQNPYLRAVSEPQIVNVQGRPARNGPGSWHEIHDAGVSIVTTANITRCTICIRSLRFLLHSFYLAHSSDICCIDKAPLSRLDVNGPCPSG